VSGACEPSLWRRPSLGTGKRISDCQRRKGAKTDSGRGSLSLETTRRYLILEMPANCGPFVREPGNLEPATRPLSAACCCPNSRQVPDLARTNAASTMVAEKTGLRLRIER